MQAVHVTTHYRTPDPRLNWTLPVRILMQNDPPLVREVVDQAPDGSLVLLTNGDTCLPVDFVMPDSPCWSPRKNLYRWPRRPLTMAELQNRGTLNMGADLFVFRKEDFPRDFDYFFGRAGWDWALMNHFPRAPKVLCYHIVAETPRWCRYVDCWQLKNIQLARSLQNVAQGSLLLRWTTGTLF